MITFYLYEEVVPGCRTTTPSTAGGEAKEGEGSAASLSLKQVDERGNSPGSSDEASSPSSVKHASIPNSPSLEKKDEMAAKLKENDKDKEGGAKVDSDLDDL